MKVREAAGASTIATEFAKQALFHRGSIHVHIFALDIQNDDGPAVDRRFFDQHLGGVGFSRTHRAEDADISGQNALVLALQAEEQVFLAGKRPQHHVAGEAEQVRDLVGRDLVDYGSGHRPALGVVRPALGQLALNLDLGEDDGRLFARCLQ